jgi:hypothetical protein
MLIKKTRLLPAVEYPAKHAGGLKTRRNALFTAV